MLFLYWRLHLDKLEINNDLLGDDENSLILTEIINRNFVNKVNIFNNAVKFKVTNIHHLLK